MPGPELEATIGEDAAYLVTLYDSDGVTISGLTGSEPLSGSIWAGEDQAAAFAPTCTWSDAAHAVVKVAVAGTQTASLPAGLYALLVRITTSSGTSDAIRGTFRLLASPGTATARPVYSTFQRMLDRAPWLARLQQADAGLSGFAAERADAREWLDHAILRHWRGAGISYATYPNAALIGGAGAFRTGMDDPYMVDLLASNKLIVDPKVIEVVTLYAIGLAARGQAGPDDKGGFYQAQADLFLARAEDRLVCLTAQIDLNADGKPELAIDLGSTDTLWA